ncbi:MAG: hypothetical protein EAX89_06960 [Candidatus Lokiarchaeota archaeon]|nr:hypothetical protein [Candidatus Lokiarchaeota archaeon]
MKKTKILTIITLSLLVFLPFIRFSTSQGAYVGTQEGDEYLWQLSVYSLNFGTYFADNLEDSLGILFPLGDEYNMTRVYGDWSWGSPPQSNWPITVNAIGTEETGQLLPLDPTIITSTPVNGTAGYEIPSLPIYNTYWDSTWYIVNDTSSYIHQTLYLALFFSGYGIMGVPFIPTTINWATFVSESLAAMSIFGGLYNNVSLTALSNGFTLNVPPLGFDNNSVAIDIEVNYDANGVLTYYEFSYGAQMLVKYTLVEPFAPVITSTPVDFSVETGYTGVSIQWTATDLSPNTYTIALQGSGNVAGPLAWSSGSAITYNVPTGLIAGNYTYTITITDDYGLSVTDSVIMTVEESEPEPQPEPEGIPGYDPLIVIGVFTIASFGLFVLIKKNKK